jgi:hypothetical protein
MQWIAYGTIMNPLFSQSRVVNSSLSKTVDNAHLYH